jgi:hypothetical protein
MGAGWLLIADEKFRRGMKARRSGGAIDPLAVANGDSAHDLDWLGSGPGRFAGHWKPPQFNSLVPDADGFRSWDNAITARVVFKITGIKVW